MFRGRVQVRGPTSGKDFLGSKRKVTPKIGCLSLPPSDGPQGKYKEGLVLFFFKVKIRAQTLPLSGWSTPKEGPEGPRHRLTDTTDKPNETKTKTSNERPKTSFTDQTNSRPLTQSIRHSTTLRWSFTSSRPKVLCFDSTLHKYFNTYRGKTSRQPLPTSSSSERTDEEERKVSLWNTTKE